MSLTKTELRQRIVNRVATVFGNDFDTYISARLDARIDALIAEQLDESIDAIIRTILTETPQYQNRIKNATTLTT